MDFPIQTLQPKNFPTPLQEIPDMPKALHMRGKLPDDSYTYLCVVGSRRTTQYGQRILYSLLSGLTREKIVIVSGLAWGTDANAHKAALELGLKTIAVMPSGLNYDVMYPTMNRGLAKQILKSGGALLSENPNGFKAMIHSFAQRNRIAAGMSKAALIIEAGEKSGTLITARLALDYNREVLVVPHEIGHPNGIGCNTLIHEGATLVRNSEDILRALGFKVDAPTQQTLPLGASEAETLLFEALEEPLTRDELLEKIGLEIQEVNIALSSLLIRGLINEKLGKIERM